MSVGICEQLVGEYVRTLGEQFAGGTSDGSVWLVSPYTFSDGDLGVMTDSQQTTLVLGGTGRTGSLVAQKLIEQAAT